MRPVPTIALMIKFTASCSNFFPVFIAFSSCRFRTSPFLLIMYMEQTGILCQKSVYTIGDGTPFQITFGFRLKGAAMKRKLPDQSVDFYDIYDEISKTKNEIDTAYCHFQYAVDPDLIDYYIYQVNAAWKKYQFLLKKAKEL